MSGEKKTKEEGVAQGLSWCLGMVNSSGQTWVFIFQPNLERQESLFSEQKTLRGEFSVKTIVSLYGQENSLN